MEQFKTEIDDLKDLGFSYPLRANLSFNRFEIFDSINRRVYPPNPSNALAWKEKEGKFVNYMVKLLNDSIGNKIEKADPIPLNSSPELETKRGRGRPPKVK
jgi:hypothetical protein